MKYLHQIVTQNKTVARRVWTLLENFDYLLGLTVRKDIPAVLSRLFPWVLKIIWKNKNTFAFEEKVFDVSDTVNKMHEEARQWFEVNSKETGEQNGVGGRAHRDGNWRAPSLSGFKCKFGIVWYKGKNMVGAGWIVIDYRGDVMLHSRRAFSGINSLSEAKHIGLLWALESICSHRLENVCVWKLKLLSWWVLWTDQVLGLLSVRMGVNLDVLWTNYRKGS